MYCNTDMLIKNQNIHSVATNRVNHQGLPAGPAWTLLEYVLKSIQVVSWKRDFCGWILPNKLCRKQKTHRVVEKTK